MLKGYTCWNLLIKALRTWRLLLGRQWLTERVLGMDGKFAGRPTYGNDSEMGTVHRDGHYAKPHHDEMTPEQARDMAGRF